MKIWDVVRTLKKLPYSGPKKKPVQHIPLSRGAMDFFVVDEKKGITIVFGGPDSMEERAEPDLRMIVRVYEGKWR